MQFKSGSITRTGGSRTTDQLSIVATGPRTAGINIPKPRSLMTVPSKRSRAPGPRRKRYIDNIIFSLSLSLSSCLKKAGSDELFTLDPKSSHYGTPHTKLPDVRRTSRLQQEALMQLSNSQHNTIQYNTQQQTPDLNSITAQWYHRSTQIDTAKRILTRQCLLL